MKKTPYIILSLKLLEFEKEKFDRFFQTFMRMVDTNTLLQDFFVERINKSSEVMIKILPNQTLEHSPKLDDLLESTLILRLLTITDNYFLMKPRVIMHSNKVKNKENLNPVLSE